MSARLARWSRGVVVLMLALALGACASAPRHGALPASAKGDRYSGDWAGTWRSEATGHHGKLTCRFTRLQPQQYRAEFYAQWAIFRGAYTVPFRAQSRGGMLSFAGEHDLGAIFGGRYQYAGTATAKDFQARYQSSADHGTFVMTKVR